MILLLVKKDTRNGPLLNSVKAIEEAHMRHSDRDCEMNSWVWSSKHGRATCCLPLQQNQHFCGNAPCECALHVRPLHFSMHTQNYNLPSLNFSQPSYPIPESGNSLSHSPKCCHLLHRAVSEDRATSTQLPNSRPVSHPYQLPPAFTHPIDYQSLAAFTL